jgi:glycosyltransferase involved in cell wall biosynthesis
MTEHAAQSEEGLAEAQLEMSIIIPVHNEAPIIEGSIRELYARVEKFSKSFEIIIAENGSRDDTAEIATMLTKELPRVKLIQTGEPNYGKALRQGIMMSRGRYVHCDEIDICDADFHRRARELFHGEDGGFDMVVGSKTMAGARDERPLSRRAATKVINGMLRISLGFRGSDTHGLKAFRRETILPVVESCVVDRDMFSSELVIRAERAKKRIVEIPLNLKEKREPSIQLTKRVPRVMRNLAQLVYVIRIKGN